jgi:hypothetical protein
LRSRASKIWWFTYFRIYGPEEPSNAGSWRPGDFEEVR